MKIKLRIKQLKFSVVYKFSSFFKIIFTLSLVLLLTNRMVNAQDNLDVIRNNWHQFIDAPNSLYHHLTGQAYDLLDKRADKIAKLSFLSEWQQYQQWLRKTLLNVVGPFPEKTPLNAKVIRIIDKDDYKVEHIVYESQPGFYITSSLFIPGGLKRRSNAPAVIYCSGHTNEGYRSEAYQYIILNLVKKGFIVFAFDPVGQGERLEYYDPKTGRSVIGGPTKEHSYPGAQAFITGSSQARYMIWDGIRAIDYLFTRKEVDISRIGITGRSGGGTQSAYLAALDDRIYAAAPECYITNFTRLLQSIGPQDAEQNLFNGILRGIDHADFLLARAPKPALMITTTRDFFSIQGARETAKEVSRIYKAFGQDDNFSMVEDDFPHQSTKKNREAMYAFFQKHLDNPGSSNDQEVELLSKTELQVTKTGQVSTSFESETVFSLNRKESEKLIIELKSSRQDLANHLSNVLKTSKKLSGYREPIEVHEPVFAGRFQREAYVIEKYFVQGEGDYVIPYLLMIPEKSNNKALIYLHPSGKSAEVTANGEIEWFISNGFTVLAPDMIGIGEIGPGNFRGDAYIDGISHNIWYASMLIGRSIVGIQTGDVVRLSQLLEKNEKISDIYGVAREELAPVLLHAAAFNPAINRIAIIGPFYSYRYIVMNRFYNSSYIPGTVPGALETYDLPDLAASLAPRKLLIAGITDDLSKNIDSDNMVDDLTVIKAAYQYLNAGSQLSIIIREEPKEKPDNLFMEWIN